MAPVLDPQQSCARHRRAVLVVLVVLSIASQVVGLDALPLEVLTSLIA